MKKAILIIVILMASIIPASRGIEIYEKEHALPPSAPQNLTAESANGYVTLRWEPASSLDMYPVRKYNIYRGNSSQNETYLTSVDASVTSYNDRNVIIGRTYYYYVTAVNDVGESNRSNEVQIVVENTANPPEPPRNLVAIRGEKYVILTWDSPVYDGGSAVTEYCVYRNGKKLASTTTMFLRYNDTEIDIHSKYTYYITAVNEVGESKPSNEVTIQWSKPTPPLNLKIERNGDYALLTWEQGDAGGLRISEYKIYVNYGNGWKYVGKTTKNIYKLKLSSSLFGGTAKIKVTEVNALGESDGIIVETTTPSNGIILYAIVISLGVIVIFLLYLLYRRRS